MALPVSLLLALSLQGCLLDASLISPYQKYERKLYGLDIAKLREWWHRALVHGLIEAYTGTLLHLLPHMEQVLYGVCIREAKTTVALAKCAVRVFDTRDAMRKPENEVGTVSSSSDVLHRDSFGARSHPDTIFSRRKLLDIKVFLKKMQMKTRFSYISKEKTREKRSNGHVANNETTLSSNAAATADLDRSFTTEGVATASQASEFDIRPAPVRKSILKNLDHLRSGSNYSIHMRNLQTIRDHFHRVDECNEFLRKLNGENMRFFNELKLGIESQPAKIQNGAIPIMNELLDTINTFTAKTPSEKLSFLSPRILSLFPEKTSQEHSRLLSPTILSFHKEEIFHMVAVNEKQQNALLDVIMDLSGAGEALEDTLAKLKPEIEEVRYVKLPLVQELSRKHDRWMRMQASLTQEQREDYAKNGYAFMNANQLKLIYSPQELLRYDINTSEVDRMTKEEKIMRVERDIRALAAFDRPKGPAWGSGRFRRQAGGITWRTFSPSVFAVNVGGGGALEVITLSPQAFILNVLNPRALAVETLSPRVFVGAVLSPNALIARIVSPTSFRMEIISPRAFNAWILTPESFNRCKRKLSLVSDYVNNMMGADGAIRIAQLLNVLSPRFFDPRVVSPLAFVIDVLRPAFLSPKAASPSYGTISVLSPGILSPRTLSDEIMAIEVLSPHIMGGFHSHREAFHSVSEYGSHSPHYGGHPHETTRGEYHGHELHGGELENILHIGPFIEIQNPV